MPLPSTTVVIRDGGLGLVGPSPAGLHVKIGAASDGPIGSLVPIRTPQQARSVYGYGPLPEAIARAVQRGGLVYGYRVSASPGVQGTWSDPNIGSTGTPLDDYQWIVEIVQGGGLGTATFRASFDGGATWTDVLTTAPTYTGLQTETGLTLTFASGPYSAGQTSTSTSTAPSISDTAISDAIVHASSQPEAFEGIHIVQTRPTVSDYVTTASAVVTATTTAISAARYLAYVALDGTLDTASNLAMSTAADAILHPSVTVGYGTAKMPSPLGARAFIRPVMWAAIERVIRIPLSQDPAAVEDGPLQGVSDISYDAQTATTELLDRGYTVARSIPGRVGVYLAGCRMRTTLTSDYVYLPNRRVVCEAARITYQYLLNKQSSKLRIRESDDDFGIAGSPAEDECRRIEASLTSLLSQGLLSPGDATAVSARVDRTVNLLLTEKLKAWVTIVPVGYARTIEAEIGLDNPGV